LIKIGKGRIQDLTGDVPFLKWIISDKRLPAPSRSGSEVDHLG